MCNFQGWFHTRKVGYGIRSIWNRVDASRAQGVNCVLGFTIQKPNWARIWRMFDKLLNVGMVGIIQAICSFVFRTNILALRLIDPIPSSGSLRRTCAKPAMDFFDQERIVSEPTPCNLEQISQWYDRGYKGLVIYQVWTGFWNAQSYRRPYSITNLTCCSTRQISGALW